MKVSSAKISSSVTLNNGIEMPRLGLGVWQMAPGAETEESVLYALKLGYRHIDTAKLYRNEESVGKAVRESGIPREEIFVTTKLWPTDALHAQAAFEESLRRLDIGYVDLYLIHWPIPLMGKAVWRRLEKIYEQKLARAIGVSNYSIEQLREVLSEANVLPAVNQFEYNPYSYDEELLQFCLESEVAPEAYSPLNRAAGLKNHTLRRVALAHGKTPAQVMLRWALQKGAVVIPKSSHRSRMKENMELFDFSLTEEEMRDIDELS